MDWSKFFSMGGYALYVWSAYGITLLALGSEVIALYRRSKAARQGLREYQGVAQRDGIETKA
jgi:heme exporter protein CcmD